METAGVPLSGRRRDALGCAAHAGAPQRRHQWRPQQRHSGWCFGLKLKRIYDGSAWRPHNAACCVRPCKMSRRHKSECKSTDSVQMDQMAIRAKVAHEHVGFACDMALSA